MANGSLAQTRGLTDCQPLLAILLIISKSDQIKVRSQITFILASLANKANEPQILWKLFRRFNVIELFFKCLLENRPNILIDVLGYLHHILNFGELFKDPSDKNSFVEEINSNKEWRCRLREL